MKPQELIEHFGSDIKVAAAIGVSQQAVRNWKEADSIPRLTQFAIQAITKNKLMADKDEK
jgi:hypothetical protein